MLIMALTLAAMTAGTAPSPPAEVSFGGPALSAEEGGAPASSLMPEGVTHSYEVQIQVRAIPPEKMTVMVELAGARQAAHVGMHIAAGAITLAGAFLNGPVATAMNPWLGSAAQQLLAAERQVFVVSGKKLEPLGDGRYLLRFKFKRLAAGTPMARVTVRGSASAGAAEWQVTTAWTPLVTGAISASSDSRSPE